MPGEIVPVVAPVVLPIFFTVETGPTYASPTIASPSGVTLMLASLNTLLLSQPPEKSAHHAQSHLHGADAAATARRLHRGQSSLLVNHPFRLQIDHSKTTLSNLGSGQHPNASKTLNSAYLGADLHDIKDRNVCTGIQVQCFFRYIDFSNTRTLQPRLVLL